MPDDDLPTGFTRYRLADCVTVGAPPVAVAAAARALAAAGDDAEPVATVREAFPQLDADQVQATLDLLESRPELTTLELRRGEALSLAVAYGLGVALSVVGALGLYGQVTATDSSSLPLPAPVALAVFALGVGLQRFSRWAQVVAGLAGLSAVHLGLILLFATTVGDTALAWVTLMTLILAGCCLRQATACWYTPEGSAASRGLSLSAYRHAVVWLTLIAAALLVMVPTFGAMFKEVGVRLPVGTRALLEASLSTRSLGFFVPALVVLGPVPLLRLPPDDEQLARLGCWIIGLGTLGGIVGWLFAPGVQILQQL